LFSNATILGSGLVQTIVAMISSNLARRGHPSRIFLAANSLKGRAAGIRLDSVVMTDNLATVLESEIDSVLGHMADMLEVDGALKHTLGLD
jgi:mRNA interferase MazF